MNLRVVVRRDHEEHDELDAHVPSVVVSDSESDRVVVTRCLGQHRPCVDVMDVMVVVEVSVNDHAMVHEIDHDAPLALATRPRHRDNQSYPTGCGTCIVLQVPVHLRR